MKIVITGADGQLGRALQTTLSLHELTPLAHGQLDIGDRGAVQLALSAARPDLVINAAAWTDTAGCERDPERAVLVNAEGARSVAEAAREAGAAMVQVSTNEIFGGEKAAPYDEDEPAHPINAYGRSKLAGEEAVRATLDRHYIVRTSWLYGPGRDSFPEKILAVGRKAGSLRVVTDEIASPTLTIDLAGAIAGLIETGQCGTYHLTNSGECSRKEWAEEVLRLAVVDVPIEATTQAEYGSPVRKPPYSVLANNRAAALGITLRPWREALREYMESKLATNSGARA
jgi:dTDP-4-dehydrorhamnose reductase